ncbi:hypothetical protein ASF61_09700 [Duganella sp. Leaf126]|nr:hypothetical protein ASF61_09700 [Duganella sp. Leaf126]
MAADEKQPLQQVEINGPDSGQRRRDDSLGRIAVGRDALQRYGDTSLADVLKRQPGLSVVGGELRMRGLGGGYTRILIDGQPAPANFDPATLSPDLVERVELQRSAQADASMQSIAGTLNIVLRKATGAARGSAKLSAERQAGVTSPAATAQWIGRNGLLGYGLTTTVIVPQRRDDALTDSYARRAAATASQVIVAQRRLRERQDSRTRRFTAAPRLDARLDGGSSVTWQGLVDLAQLAADGTQSEHTVTGLPTAWPENGWRSRSDDRLLKSDLGWEQRFGTCKLTLRAGLDASHRDSRYRFLGVDAAGNAGLDRAVASLADERRASTSGKYLAPLSASHDIAIGWDASRVRRAETRHQRDSGHGDDAGSDAPAVTTLDQDYAATVHQLALFAQDEWTVSPRLQAYLGLRWEGLATRVALPGAAGATGATSTTGATNTTTTTARVWSPVAQLVWKLPDSARTQLRLALARTYKAPQPRDLVPRRYTVNNDNSATQPDYQGNPLLRPELAWGLDAALEVGFARDAMLSVSAYARRIRDVVQRQLWQENGVWVSSPVNHGNASVHGLELDMRLPLMPAAGLDLHANVGRNWSRVDAVAGPDNRLGNQAPLTANLGLDRKTAGGLSAGANLRLVGGWRAATAQSLTDTTGVVRELEAYAAWPAAGGHWRLTLANLLRPDRRSAVRYDDGVDSSERYTARPQHPLVRLQYEVQR